MNPTDERPTSDASDRQKRWSREFSVFATDATARLGRWGRRLRTTNASLAGWITGITWRRLALIAFLFLIATQIVGGLTGLDRREVKVDVADLDKPVEIRIDTDDKGVHIQPRVGGKATRPVDVPIPPMPEGAVPALPADLPPAPPPIAASPDRGIVLEKNGKRIVIDRNGVRVLEGEEAQKDAAERARADVEAAQRQALIQRDSDEGAKPSTSPSAARDGDRMRRAIAEDMSLQVKAAVEDAKDEVTSAISDEIRAAARRAPRTIGNVFWEMVKFMIAMAFIYLVILKATTNTKRRAAVAVQSASEVAERESLKRQVSEAKMQMMQAQVEPHFLFNTLASIDHLIETDPARASTMQKNLIAYLRAALPQMRESATDLGRETDLVRAYLEILKVRMEERLQVSFAVPAGLRSADFPPMMLQSLVENAIKHGLEPKADGGRIEVAAEIVHGDLEVAVTDTGLGFSPDGAPTAGTGLGLSNIRERLKLLYGDRAALVIEAHIVDGAPNGTRASIRVPYQSRRSTASRGVGHPEVA